LISGRVGLLDVTNVWATLILGAPGLAAASVGFVTSAIMKSKVGIFKLHA
jgi:protein transport protein SEC24